MTDWKLFCFGLFLTDINSNHQFYSTNMGGIFFRITIFPPFFKNLYILWFLIVSARSDPSLSHLVCFSIMSIQSGAVKSYLKFSSFFKNHTCSIWRLHSPSSIPFSCVCSCWRAVSTYKSVESLLCGRPYVDGLLCVSLIYSRESLNRLGCLVLRGTLPATYVKLNKVDI